MSAAPDIHRIESDSPEERLASDERAFDALIVEIAGRRYGLPAALVRELARAAAIMPAAEGSEIEGLVNLHGAIVPVFDLRARLHLPPKPIEPSDHFIAIGLDSPRAVVRVDRTIDLVRLGPEEWERPGLDHPGSDCVSRIARRPGELVPILDLAAMFKRIAPKAPKSAAGEQAGKEAF